MRVKIEKEREKEEAWQVRTMTNAKKMRVANSPLGSKIPIMQHTRRETRVQRCE